MGGSSPIKATFWSFIETTSTQLIGLVIGIVLARLLTPDDYGTVALTSIFLAISTVIIDSGFSNAIIRKKDRTDEDLNTAFFFNIVVSLVCYLLLFVSAPFIAHFFAVPILTILIRIIGLDLIITAACSVQYAILTSQLEIRRQAFITLSSRIPAGIISIAMAYWGWGVYALVFQSLFASVIKAAILWSKTTWHPSRNVSKCSFSYLWGFGSKLVLANVIGVVFERIYSIIIGKCFSVSDLGYYGKASSLNDNAGAVSNGVVAKIALPVLSRNQESVELLRNDFREMMRVLVLFLAPLTAFLFFNSDNIILFLFTEKWIESSIYFKLLLLGTMWMPIGQLSQLLMNVINRTDVILKLEVPKKLLYVIYIVVGLKFGIVGLCCAQILVSFSAAVVNMIPTFYFLRYNYFVQMLDVIRYMVFAYICGFVISLVPSTGIIFYDIIISFFLFFPFYFSCLVLFKDRIAIKYLSKAFLGFKHVIHGDVC